MNKKTILIGIIILVIVLAGLIIINHDSGDSSSGNTSQSFSGVKTEINGYSCMIPEEYQNGNLTDYPGYGLYGTDNDTLYITVYSNDNDGDTMYNGDWAYFAEGENNEDEGPTTENRTLDGHEIVYVALHSESRGDYRLAFFEVNGKRVMLEWRGSDINPGISNIINSFYALN